MNLLFKREQASGKTGRALFNLWSKIELDELEVAAVRNYSFDRAILIEVEQPNRFGPYYYYCVRARRGAERRDRRRYRQVTRLSMRFLISAGLTGRQRPFMAVSGGTNHRCSVGHSRAMRCVNAA